MLIKRFSLFYALLILCSLTTQTVALEKNIGSEEVIEGAYLYQNKCNSCHGSYEKERLAKDYLDKRTLIDAIGEDACQIIWLKSSGGKLFSNEISAIAQFMLVWEKTQGAVIIPLPPATIPEVASSQPAVDLDSEEKPDTNMSSSLSPILEKVIQGNTIAKGGYLYTQNCYRCHLSYSKARMGKGISLENLLRFIREGKTSTQMKPFSRMLGGKLKEEEIDSIAAYITEWEKTGEPLAIAQELLRPPDIDPSEFEPIRLTQFPLIEGNADNGASLYADSCQRCHGHLGEGKIGPSLREKPRIQRTDLYLKSILKKGVPFSLMASWDSGNGGSFSAKDIDDIVALLLKWHRKSTISSTDPRKGSLVNGS